MWYGRKKVGFLADLESPFLWMQNRILFGDDADISTAAEHAGGGGGIHGKIQLGKRGAVDEQRLRDAAHQDDF